MPDAELITQQSDGVHIDPNVVPPTTPAPELNDLQKAFNQYWGENEAMKQFAAAEDPFKAVAEKVSTPAQTVVEGIKPITAESTPEDIAAFRKAIGAFEKADDYIYDAPASDDEAIKKLLPSEAPFVKAFQEIAAKNHLPEAAWKDIVGAYNQMLVEDAKTQHELSNKAMANIKENWLKSHGEAAPKVETVFQKYFAQANPAESAVLASLTPEQLTAVGSVVFRQEQRLGSEDSINTGAIGSSTLSNMDYVQERTKLLTEQRSLESQGKGWSSEATQIASKIQELDSRFAAQKK